MIFKQADAILERQKRQTRRLNFPYELATQLWKRGWSYPRCRRHRDTYEHPWYVPWDEWQSRHPITDEHIAEANCILAEHVITLPVQLDRGKKAVGRIWITGIRRERLGDISAEDVFAEGLGIYNPLDGKWYPVTCLNVAQEMYANLWNSIYGSDTWDRMKDNDVWALDFELVEGLDD